MNQEILATTMIIIWSLSCFLSGWRLMRCAILVLLWQLLTPLRTALIDSAMLAAYLLLTEILYAGLSGRLANGRRG